MESSTDEDALLPDETTGLKSRVSRWWLTLPAVGAATLAMSAAAWHVSRPLLGPRARDAQLADVMQLDDSSGAFYSSAGSTDVSFDITHDRVLKSDIDRVWPNLNVRFEEGTGSVTSQSLSDYTAELLSDPSPFGGAPGSVKIPAGQSSSDQLDWGQYVVYTRKQVCYISALIAAGNVASDYDSGLSRLIPPGKCLDDLYEAGFLRSLLGLLAACSVDPSLGTASQGPVLIVAKSTDDLTKAPSLQNSDVALNDVPLRTCRFRDGSEGNALLSSSIPQTPEAACKVEDPAPVDFMRSGNSLVGQVIVDITAAWIGGYILAHHGCGGIDGGQDERLTTTMPEVMVLSFFMSQKASPIASEGVSLLVPAYVIGARRIFADFDGTSRDIGPENFNQGKPVVDEAAPMTSDLKDVQIGQQTMKISASSPFLGFQSINQESGLAQDVPSARLNQNHLQFLTSGDYGFENQVKAWYNAVSLEFWHPDVQGVLKSIAVSIGSGPWGSGVWWGNSQIFALVAWMGQALAQQSWEDHRPYLDYYIYSSFTENPSNQCLIHSSENCKKCLQSCEDAYAGPGNNQRYCCMEPEPWIPSAGLFDDKPCIPVDKQDEICGQKGFEDVYEHFKGSTVGELWDAVKSAATNIDPTATTLFDAMLA